MRIKKILITAMLMTVAMGMNAQRATDKLDRGLVAMKVSGGVYVNWRIPAEEYYDVTYNVYRDGVKLNDAPLSVSNFKDASGTLVNKYSVSAVVRGTEQPACSPVSVWASSYKEIKLVHKDITSTLVPNDACCADVDGDGELEILMKFDNESEKRASYPRDGYNGEYSIFEVFKLDGTRLWWVNCGPNMGDFQNNEQNIVAYDWDGDGKAEAVMRAADGTTIHCADGTTYVVGDASKNYRAATGGGTNWFMHDGAEYLVYMNGETGKPYQCIEYPLKRLETGETNLEAAWGDGYGHRSSKHFFGAPYLDGKKPSIFLARGIYTRHKMIAYDVDPATHSLKERWRWFNNTNGPWKGQGYHNFGIADVDWDGRDEICFGSMVIDDNGKGLSTTGFGHGDAQHCGDFNPYIHGQEIYACNEDQPGNNYRDATTSKIYHRYNAGNDDGRSMCGNFCDDFPGAIGCSAREGAISTVTNGAVPGLGTTGVNTNFRIYWDGDLCEETFNYVSGKNTAGCIAKYGSWSPIYTCEGSMTNNDTKGTPCYQGDILGDWREEIIMRTADNNIRIYSTPTSTEYRNYSLWHDHQYRNAMVWQMCGYNQPPHASYFLGKLEGITIAPPPLTTTGRTEVANGGTVASALNDKHVLVYENANINVSIEDGAKPHVLTFNVPTWVQGSAPSECSSKSYKITYDTFTCAVSGGGLAGDARLVKQGDGILVLPKADFTHTGNTDIWAGRVDFDGTMRNSSLWLNRFAELNTVGGEFRSIRMDYDSRLRPGGENGISAITVDSLKLGFGSRVVFDINTDNTTSDNIKSKYLSIETKDWKYGPEYLTPVFEFAVTGANGLTEGKYLLGTFEKIDGDIANINLLGLDNTKKCALELEGTSLYLVVYGLRDATSVVWTGSQGSVWDVATTENFVAEEDQAAINFVNGDKVLFGEDAAVKTVTLDAEIEADSIIFDNTSSYTIQGEGAITGNTVLVKRGTGTTTISTLNTYTGGTRISGGVLSVKALANDITATGNLGGVTTTSDKLVIENGASLRNMAAVTLGSPMKMETEEGGVIDAFYDFTANRSISGTMLTKKGSASLILTTNNTLLNKLVLVAGTVTNSGSTYPAKLVELQGGTLQETGSTSYPITVAKGKAARWNLGNRCTYSNKVTGEGTLTVYCPLVDGGSWMAPRTPIKCNFSGFTGTLKPAVPSKDYRFTLDNSYGMPEGTLDIDAGIEVQNSAKTFQIGKVTGSGNLGGVCSFSNDGVSGSNTWKVGNASNFSWSGKVTGTGTSFVKTGTGKMTVSGVWDNTGTVRVSEGELVVTTGKKLGTGTLIVDDGATMSGVTGTGSLDNSSFTINGELRPGAYAKATTGKIGFGNKNVTFSSTGRYVIWKASSNNTTIYDINKLTMNGTVEVNLLASYTPKEGDTVNLWTATSFTGTPQLLLPELTPGLKWDTSKVAEGVLTVVSDPTAIEVVAGDAASQTNDIYNLRGQLVRKNATSADGLPRGVYLQNGKKIVVK